MATSIYIWQTDPESAIKYAKAITIYLSHLFEDKSWWMVHNPSCNLSLPHKKAIPYCLVVLLAIQLSIKEINSEDLDWTTCHLGFVGRITFPLVITCYVMCYKYYRSDS